MSMHHDRTGHAMPYSLPYLTQARFSVRLGFAANWHCKMLSPLAYVYSKFPSMQLVSVDSISKPYLSFLIYFSVVSLHSPLPVFRIHSERDSAGSATDLAKCIFDLTLHIFGSETDSIADLLCPGADCVSE